MAPTLASPMSYLFWISLLLLTYIYQGYYWLLRLLPVRAPALSKADYTPSVTLLLTVHNEAEVIEERLNNLLELDYPAELLQILVASDRSTDETDQLVTAIDDPRVTLFQPEESEGKTDTQNQAVSQASGDILVFTDADTRFDPMFLRALVAPFVDSQIGGATGHLRFHQDAGDGIAENQGFYWNYELKLRARESLMGWLAVGSGACLAIRRQLFLPMQAAYGEDCILPLDVVTAGKRFVFIPDAHAWDRMESTTSGELATRIRMTLRNWQGTWAYPALLNPFRNPGVAVALWSHKLLRWCSPFFLFMATIAAITLAGNGGLYFLAACGFAGFYLMALLGWGAQGMGRRIPLVHTAFSFLLANIGFAMGLLRALRGDQIRRYNNG